MLILLLWVFMVGTNGQEKPQESDNLPITDK
jgi:hypothetical protein